MDKILTSKRVFSGENNYKYFIGYKVGNYKNNMLSIKLPQTRACGKSYDDDNKWMYFLIEDGELLTKYNEIYDKVSNQQKYKNKI